MKKDHEESSLIIALKLTLICFFAVIILTITNYFTADIIKENREKFEKLTNEELFPSGRKFERKNFRSLSQDLKKLCYYYLVIDENGNTIGYIASSIGKGYGSDLNVLTSFDTKLKILNVKLLSSKEPPNADKKSEKNKYIEKFAGTNTDVKPLPGNKNMLSQQDKDAITGATITYNGIVQAISAALNLLEKEINL
jgi:RnfABCDGE-type electron transport complex G subunit